MIGALLKAFLSSIEFYLICDCDIDYRDMCV